MGVPFFLSSFPLKQPFHQMIPAAVRRTKDRATAPIAMILLTALFFSPFGQGIESGHNTERHQ